MKKIYFLIAALAFGLVATFAFTGAESTAKHNVQASYYPFKTVTPVLKSGTGNDTAVITCSYLAEQNFYIPVDDSTTITINTPKNGGHYRLLIKKTVAGVCTLTTSASVVGTTSPISLTGSTNSWFWVDFTSTGSATVLLKQ
jgi:hypothetical protein